MRHYKIAVIPADGIGREIVSEAMKSIAVLAELDGGAGLKLSSLTGDRNDI